MADLISMTREIQLCKLSGRISSYKCTRAAANFVYSDRERDNLGVIAVAAAFAGMGGQAASIVASASSLEELADHIEFSLEGEIVRGWVWRSPFRDGDDVNVVAQWQGNHYEAYGVARPSDKVIALYPHCSRSRGCHIRNAVKWWYFWNLGYFGFTVALVLGLGMVDLLSAPVFFWGNATIALIFILMFISLCRKYMPFVRLAERVFQILELPDAQNIDLVKSSKNQRTAADSWELGTFYFRY